MQNDSRERVHVGLNEEIGRVGDGQQDEIVDAYKTGQFVASEDENCQRREVAKKTESDQENAHIHIHGVQ